MNNPFFEAWKKLFFSPYFFTIAIREKQDRNLLEDTSFRAEFVMPATQEKWYADPILVDHEGKTFLFYEAVNNDHGRIEVVEVLKSCTLGEPTVILEDECHYSYPFVFQWQGNWYMIPESSASNQVRLYRSVDFPTKWEMMDVLLQQQSVDTTVFEWDGQLYLLTYLLCPGSERVKPQAYKLVLGERNTITPVEWADYDELKCRGAGPVFWAGDKAIRPAQSSDVDRYGNSVLLYEIQSCEKRYMEERKGELTSDRIAAKGVWLDGLHTYAVSAHYEAIDIRCRAFDWLKTPRTLWNRKNKKSEVQRIGKAEEPGH